MLDTNEKEEKKLQVSHGRGDWYEAVDKYGKKFLVSVADVMCDCGMWQISVLPCMHAIAVFMYRKEFAQDYVHWYYSKEALKMTYNGTINPIPDESRWPIYQFEIIEQPMKRTKVGRSKKNKRRATNESCASGATFSKRCTACHEIGHNNLTCPRLRPMNAAQVRLHQHMWLMFAPKRVHILILEGVFLMVAYFCVRFGKI
ncbi:hypothetical protein LWI28_004786 [Acer negundo]|uniref:SWIM-type domain-containing protein n=1 Tax=Acer negundo TaxID=4023 RepID=A0AAD5JA36_ACENE|nr:hypothetical protein LWI28_004786 [Acer negundo]